MSGWGREGCDEQGCGRRMGQGRDEWCGAPRYNHHRQGMNRLHSSFPSPVFPFPYGSSIPHPFLLSSLSYLPSSLNSLRRYTTFSLFFCFPSLYFILFQSTFSYVNNTFFLLLPSTSPTNTSLPLSRRLRLVPLSPIIPPCIWHLAPFLSLSSPRLPLPFSSFLNFWTHTSFLSSSFLLPSSYLPQTAPSLPSTLTLTSITPTHRLHTPPFSPRDHILHPDEALTSAPFPLPFLALRLAPSQLSVLSVPEGAVMDNKMGKLLVEWGKNMNGCRCLFYVLLVSSKLNGGNLRLLEWLRVLLKERFYAKFGQNAAKDLQWQLVFIDESLSFIKKKKKTLMMVRKKCLLLH